MIRLIRSAGRPRRTLLAAAVLLGAWFVLSSPALRAGQPLESAKGEAGAAKAAQDDEELYDLLKLFVDTLDQIDRNYVKDTSRRELLEAAIEGMLSKLDQYSSYIPPDDLEEFRSGVENEFGGIGVQIGVEDGWLTIISPLPGTPAQRAGLQAGDRIVRIGQQSTRGMSIDDARELLTGKPGSRVTFTVRRAAGGELKTVTITREVIRIHTVLGWRHTPDGGWNYWIDPDNKIAYVRISAFGRHTAEELEETLQALTRDGMRALLLDLRFNPGGLMAAAIETCDLFIESGVIVSTEGRNVRRQVWEAHRDNTYSGFPMAVLVNRASASASEIVAACLQDHQRAVIAGERTWGKGSVQNIIELEGGRSALKLTTASYRRPSGKNIHRFPGATEQDDWGVRPDPEFNIPLSQAERTRLYVALRRRELLGRRRPQEPGGGAEGAQAPEASPKNAKPGGDQPDASGDTEQAAPAAGEAGAPSEPDGQRPAPPFVDRQLQKALEHLRSRLGAGERPDDKRLDKQQPAKLPPAPVG